jgi:hypothetical protein
MQLQQEALKTQRLYHLPAVKQPALTVLALMTPGDLMSNVPVECLLENSDIDLLVYYATGDISLPEIPYHDVLFVAIGESEASLPLLRQWQPLLDLWPRPVINNPLNIEKVSRPRASRLLQSIDGIVMPPTLRATRNMLALPDGATSHRLPGIDFPVIIRPLDSHAGHDLNKVDSPAELAGKLSEMPGDEFYISPFIDYRSHDGLYRKYRIVLIEGKPFACHMGISENWMIHYLNAGMAESPEKRAEEARFMKTFDHDFATRHAQAISDIHRITGLDYLGIDCAETADGRLLIFEVDHAMIVHDMDPADIYPYKHEPMQKLFAAFRDMLIKVAEENVPGAR